MHFNNLAFKGLTTIGLWLPDDRLNSKYFELFYRVCSATLIINLHLGYLFQIMFLKYDNPNPDEFNEVFLFQFIILLVCSKSLNILMKRNKYINLDKLLWKRCKYTNNIIKLTGKIIV